MKVLIKENWKFLLFVLVGGLIGGFFTGLYMFDTLSPELLQQAQEQNITKELFAVVSCFEYGFVFSAVLGVVGIILSKKVNLWKEFKADKKAIISTLVITVVSALLMFPGDKLIFGALSNFVKEQYTMKPTMSKIIAGLLTGGITEEIMMRLFLMSLLVLIISKIFYKNQTEIPTKVFVISNIIVAIIFSLLHIPTLVSMTTLTFTLFVRGLIFNGLFGLEFGYLYRKYGIGYAMISHGICHLLSDILMLIFI